MPRQPEPQNPTASAVGAVNVGNPIHDDIRAIAAGTGVGEAIDAVVTTNAGRRLDQDLHQAAKDMSAGAQIVVEALARRGPGTRLTVLPEGPTTIPYPQQSSTSTGE